MVRGVRGLPDGSYESSRNLKDWMGDPVTTFSARWASRFGFAAYARIETRVLAFSALDIRVKCLLFMHQKRWSMYAVYAQADCMFLRVNDLLS